MKRNHNENPFNPITFNKKSSALFFKNIGLITPQLILIFLIIFIMALKSVINTINERQNREELMSNAQMVSIIEQNPTQQEIDQIIRKMKFNQPNIEIKTNNGDTSTLLIIAKSADHFVDFKQTLVLIQSFIADAQFSTSQLCLNKCPEGANYAALKITKRKITITESNHENN
jgi:hypothetical protein